MGHYKKTKDGWLFASANSAVIHKEYLLCWETHEDASYPIDGWYWHDTPPMDYLKWEESQI